MDFLALAVGIVWILIGLMILFNVLRSKAIHKLLLGLGLYFLLAGAVAILGYYLKNKLLAYGGSFLALAFLSLGIGLYQLHESRRYKETVHAEYLGYKTYPAFKTINTYKVLFAYSFKGEAYTSESRTAYSNLGFEKTYKKSQKYPIYLDPKVPSRITERRLESKSANLLFFLSVACFILFLIFLTL